MGAENGPNGAAIRLTSWKEIATFLRRDERTVKRWEESRGLPVRRLPGSGRASVFAYAHELEAWRDGVAARADGEAGAHSGAIPASTTTRPHRFSWAAAASFVAIAAIGAALAILWIGQPVPVKTAGNSGAGKHDAVAVEYYKSGLHEWQTRTPSGLARAVSDFDNALRRDPGYAEAYVGLANTYNVMREFTSMPANEAYAKARIAAMRAIALQPSLASAHAALAFTDFYWLRDVPGARAEFARAIALDPRGANTRHWYATFLMTIGSFEAARHQIDKAAELDTESTAILSDKALILFFAGHPQAAVALLKQIETDQPLFSSPHLYLAAIYLIGGNDRGYLQEMKLQANALHDPLGAALSAAGERGLAAGGHMQMLRDLLAAQLPFYARGKISAYGVAQTYALLGDRHKALDYLSASVARHEPDNIVLKINPSFASLRNMPEFERLLVSTSPPEIGVAEIGAGAGTPE